MLLKFKPTKIDIIQTNGKKTCAQVRRQTGCNICINGTLYNMKNYVPVCDQKIDNVILSDDPYTYVGYGWNEGDSHATVSTNMHMWDNYISGIMMVYNSLAQEMYYDKKSDSRRGRTAIGYLPDGRMLIYVSKDKTGDACTIKQLQTKMLGYECESALNLDGGGSSQIDCDKGKITSSRKVANYICIWTNDCLFTEPTKLVKYNSTGEGAKWVQWHLNKALEGEIKPLSVDGIFGAKSLQALKQFQKKAGIAVDGLCGKDTRTMLKKYVKI